MARQSPRACSLAAVLSLLVLARPARASQVSVPPHLQAVLAAKVAPFDRSLAARAGERISVLVAIRAGDAESEKVGVEFADALRLEPGIGGLPFDVVQVEISSAKKLLAEILARHPAIVYLSTSFSEDAAELAKGLSGEDVLTVAAESSAVPLGICVGFNLISGRPRVLIHLQQSRRQHVDFQAALLNLAMVVDQ